MVDTPTNTPISMVGPWIVKDDAAEQLKMFPARFYSLLCGCTLANTVAIYLLLSLPESAPFNISFSGILVGVAALQIPLAVVCYRVEGPPRWSLAWLAAIPSALLITILIAVVAVFVFGADASSF